jgi:hypothetical protein
MAIVVVVGDPLGVTLTGVKLHVAPKGSPEQANVTAWLKPFKGSGVIVNVVFTLCPTGTLRLDCPAVTVKSTTSTLATDEVEEEKVVPPL